MTHDIETLNAWSDICLIIAAVTTTAFPILYAFSPWYKTRIGRAFMTQTVAFALALDFTVMFHVWTPPDPLFRFWVKAIVYTLIAIATSGLTMLLWQYNYAHRKSIREDEDNDDDTCTCC